MQKLNKIMDKCMVAYISSYIKQLYFLHTYQGNVVM